MEKEKNEEEMGSKPKADPVFFISLVGVDSLGVVDEYEHIFDIYTKAYDFQGSDVKVKSAQDLWKFYKKRHIFTRRRNVNIFTLAKYFVKKHSNGNYILDECPFIDQCTSKSI